MPKKATPSERRKLRAEAKQDRQTASSQVLREKMPVVDAFSQPRLIHQPKKSGTKGAPKPYVIVCEDTVSGWYYLDDLLVDMQLPAVCGHVCEELEEWIPDGQGYAKKEENTFARLAINNSHGRSQAMKRAEKLRRQIGTEFSNPSTQMDLLFHCLQKLKITVT